MKKKAAVRVQMAVIGVLFGLLGMCLKPMYAAAADETAMQTEGGAGISESGQLMTADDEVDMKAEPSDSAETIMTYKKGDMVFVTGEAENGWYRAIYQNKEGYIPQDSLSVQEIDVAVLDEEMARTEQEAEFVIDTVERYRAEARCSKIWGTVIVVLVLGIFATGIISGIKNAKGKEEKL